MADLNSTIVRGKLRVTEDMNVNGNITGNGSGLTNLNASNISSGTLSADRLATSGATAGSYGPSANATPAYGAKFNVPYITIDNKGRVTAASTKTVTIPASDNIDTKNTAGATNDTGKLYLIGAKEQTDNPQTYSNRNVYRENYTLTTDTLSVGSIDSIDNYDIKIHVRDQNAAGLKDVGYFGLGKEGTELSLDGHLVTWGNDDRSHPFKPTNQANIVDPTAYYFNTGIALVDTNNAKCKLSFPGKSGTIALTSDLSTLLDKGTENSSMVTDQVIYNPVEMQKRLTLPSVGGIKIRIDGISGNEAPLFLLKGAASGNDHISALILSSLPIGATDISTLSATKIEQRAGSFTIQHRKYKTETDSILSPVFGFNEDHG